MNILKSIVVLVLAAVFSTACKDTASKPADSELAQHDNNTPAVAANPQTASFKIEGMTCAMGCAKTIEEKLTGIKGVQKACVDFETKTATVNYDADQLDPSDLTKAVEACADGKTYKVAGEVSTSKS